MVLWPAFHMAMLKTVFGVNVCALFVCIQEIEICINKRSDEPAGPSSDTMVESCQSLASTSVATLLVQWIPYLQLAPQLHVLLPELVSVLIFKWANVSGFIAQLVKASHGYHEVTGSNPVEILTFSGFYTQLLKLRSELQWS